MNYKLVFRLLGRLLLLEAALMLPSLAVSLIYGQGDTLAFLITIGITAAVGALPAFLLKPRRQDLNARDGMAVAGLSWAVLSFFGALPAIFSGAIPNLIDAYFETVSGFTTTGSTILTDIEALPRGILFWRSFTHWIGGMGVLVLTVALLPRLSGRTSLLAKAESPGPTFSKLLPRMSDSAKLLYGLYILLSCLEFVCLLLAGMSVYDALIHTFGTAGTGGFSNYGASIAAFDSPLLEWIIGIFMMLFGVNFAVYFHLLRREWGLAAKSEELWVYLGLVLLATLGITATLVPGGMGFFTALRQAFFQSTSIISTTGFATADFELWPGIAKAILLLLMCVGACAGSTAGGFKVSRAVLLVKSVIREIRRALTPRKISVVRFEGKSVQEDTLAQLGIYAFLYVILALLGGFLVSFAGTDLTTSFSAALTCLSNVGPGFGAIGPIENFAFFPWGTKLLLSFLMLAGRLEIYPVLVLFAPSLWKKN